MSDGLRDSTESWGGTNTMPKQPTPDARVCHDCDQPSVNGLYCSFHEKLHNGEPAPDAEREWLDAQPGKLRIVRSVEELPPKSAYYPETEVIRLLRIYASHVREECAKAAEAFDVVDENVAKTIAAAIRKGER